MIFCRKYRRLSASAPGQVNPAFESSEADVEAPRRPAELTRQPTVTFIGPLSAKALESKPFAPLKKKSSLLSLWSNDSRDEKLKNLKQELELDEHKLPLAALYSRLKTNPQTVFIFYFFFNFPKKFKD